MNAVYVRVVFNEDSELGAARRGSLLALKGVNEREQRQAVRGLIRDHRSRTDGRINKPSVMNESGSLWRAVGDRIAPLIVTSQSPSLPSSPGDGHIKSTKRIRSGTRAVDSFAQTKSF